MGGPGSGRKKGSGSGRKKMTSAQVAFHKKQNAEARKNAIKIGKVSQKARYGNYVPGG